MEIGMNITKYLLFAFNLIFALSGLAVIMVGVLVLSEVGSYSHFLENKVLAPPIVLIVAGGIVFFIAFLGCCGAIKENYYMLIAFAVLLMVIFIVELAVGIAASVAKDEFASAMRGTLNRSMGNYTQSRTDQSAWDTMQRKLKCCGVDGPQGWSTVFADGNVPASCCVANVQNDPNALCRNSDDSALVFQSGCYEKLKNKTKDNIVIIMGVGIGIAFVELAGVILACCLANAIKKEEELK
ncbi:CD63 antigen-like isoform X1 [Macrosteles quadrilineatus]|uniref:CD63 antigen-like isoform X1 n=1 Tax=Macrosteles quadrilineatus TaxID=74068 RepID=UPI0023E2FD07|nr:CD63 antigen-like isoform X1 [Macrosteles quadrilineatus]